MKLCKLRLKNLNSLAGEWSIDFEDHFFDANLFAITGPTGSGKTTLLDAFCLALFACTPRLEKITDSDNEIMTHGKNECRAAAEFVVDRVRYEASWSQRRSKSGKLQPAKHTLSRLTPNKEILAENLTEVRNLIPKVTRLDFERFTRTVLLPQGGFAKFLQSGEAERAKLLENLSDAGIYRRIAKEVHNRNNLQKQALTSLEEDERDCAVLPDEERDVIESRLANSDAREKELKADLEILQEKLAWQTRFEKLAASRDKVAQERAEYETERKEFERQSEALDRAKRARSLDDLYSSLKGTRQDADNNAQKEQKLRAEAENASARRDEAKANCAKAMDELSLLQKEHDEKAEVWRVVRNLDEKMTRESSENFELEKKQKDLEQKKAEFEKSDKELLESVMLQGQEVNELKEKIERLRSEKDATSQQIYSVELSDLAAQLEEGKPCPLCGSIHHPQPCSPKDGNSKNCMSGAELRKKLEKTEKKLKEFEEKLNKSEEKADSLQLERKGVTTQLRLKENELAEAQKNLETKKKSLDLLQKLRNDQYGEVSPDKDEELLKKRLAEVQKSSESMREESAAADNEATKAETSLKECLNRREELKKQLDELQSRFAERIAKEGFKDETELAAAHLSPEEIESLEGRDKELKERGESLLRDEKSLEEEENAIKQHEDEADEAESEQLDCGELNQKIDADHKEIEKIHYDRGAEEERIKHDDAARAKLAELKQKIEAQKKACAVWADLKNLIGNANGDNYSNFVQGLTFNYLVDAANKQLEVLSDRYRLRASGKDNLNLDVIDLWQGGEARSSRNLSGGESFIVSLALALGLSHGMSGVHVDSLFLDEGFGTLDEESLETVLNCLEHLRSRGKTIGIISHVAALRERIECRITLMPVGDGISRLEGPGCARIS